MSQWDVCGINKPAGLKAVFSPVGLTLPDSRFSATLLLSLSTWLSLWGTEQNAGQLVSNHLKRTSTFRHFYTIISHQSVMLSASQKFVLQSNCLALLLSFVSASLRFLEWLLTTTREQAWTCSSQLCAGSQIWKAPWIWVWPCSSKMHQKLQLIKLWIHPWLLVYKSSLSAAFVTLLYNPENLFLALTHTLSCSTVEIDMQPNELNTTNFSSKWCLEDI